MRKDDDLNMDGASTPDVKPPGGTEPVAGGCLVVAGIGASAGGLETLKQFFAAMPNGSGVCFVVAMHLPPDRTSLLPEILARCTLMNVVTAEEGAAFLPDTVFLLPADKELAIRDGRFGLQEPSQSDKVSHVIDRFFRSLAAELAERAIAIVLSGAGNDGAQGVTAIKRSGGTVIVQEPETAMYADMPQSAITTGVADMILPVPAMPERIIEIARRFNPNSPRTEQAEERDDQLATILRLVRTKTGHDFSCYKTDTVLRRLQRRMAVNDVHDLAHYAALLLDNSQEAEALYKDILIGVTSFFRDPEAFAAIQKKVIPQLFANRDPDDTVRIWHPCCATGEEVYSMAILIQEYLNEQRLTSRVQFFATDLDDGAVANARAGLFPLGIATDMSEERLNTWFTRIDSHYQVAKPLREMIVFARHSLIKDPPFSRLDLLVCRNFLIYLNQRMQQRLITLFHQVLNPGGFLFLGSSETAGRHTDLFAPIDKKWKIFQREGTTRKSGALLPFSAPAPTLPGLSHSFPPGRAVEPAPVVAVEKVLMERFFPPCAVVNDKYEMVYFSNLTSRFLVQQVGEPTRDILRMVREELRPALRTAIHKAIAEQQQVEFARIKTAADSETVLVNIKVEPIRTVPALKLATVVFESVPPSPPPPAEPGEAALPGSDAMKDALIRQLEEQLRITHEQLQATVEQLETSNDGFMSVNEELTSTNEELQSTNEELQSTNEELETSREELQTLNEELVTVNAELREKVEELDQANSDLENLFASSAIATIFLDRDLTIKRYSPAMATILNTIPSDVGRPFRHLAGTFDWPDLAHDAKDVLEKLAPVEREVSAPEGGKHYLMRVLPYRTTEGEVGGIVVTLVDISARKLAEERTQHLASFPQLNPNPILEVDSSGRVTFVNPTAHRVMEELGLTEAEVGVFFPTDLDLILKELKSGNESSFYRETVIKDRDFGTYVHLVPQFGVVRIYAYDITAHKRAEERLDLLAETAGELLRAESPQQVVEGLCRKVMAFLDCDAFFNFLADREAGRLHLNACAGIPAEEARRIEWLDYGAAVCGCAARDACRIVAENIGASSDPRTDLVKAYGIQAYACHPLMVQGRVIGTLSFGTRGRTRFAGDELSLMKAVADQVAIAMDRMQSRETLRESEMRYRGLFDHMLEGFAYCRMLFEDGVARDFVYLAVNDAFETLTGLQGVVGKRVTEVIPGIRESDPELFDIYGSVAMGGEPIRFEMYVEAMGMWFDLSVYSPEKERFVAIFDVITDRKRAEEEQEITVEFLRMVNESRETGDLIRAAATIFQKHSGCEAVGVRLKKGDDYPYYEARGFPEEFILAENRLCSRDETGCTVRGHDGNPVLECMCGNVICGRFDPAKPFFTTQGSFWTNSTTELLASTSEVDRQARTRNRCHGEGYESVALIPLRVGEERLGLLQLNDRRRGRFTSAKIALWERLSGYLAVALAKLQAENGLRESESRYRRLFSSLQEGFSLLEISRDRGGNPVDYRFLEVNPAGEKLVGMNREKLIGRTIRELFPHLDEYWLNGLAQVANTGRSATLENHLNSTDGYIEMHAYSPAPGQIALLYSDVSERRKLMEEREKADRLESLGVLAGGIAHDFNNILTAIIGNISLARRNVGEEHAAAPQLAACEKALAKATDLARQLLTFSRGGEPIRQVVDTERLIREVVSFALHGSNSRAELSFTPGLWHLDADGGQIHQAINNLVINAVQAMPRGGTIRVEASNETVGDAHGRGLPAGDYVKIAVFDHGNGIAPEILGRIFDPYFTTKPAGTGLGLASVFSIVRRHGGTIDVSSTPGEGSVFTLLLPAANESGGELAVADEHGSPMPATTPGTPILVMDDEEMIRELAAEMLKTLGYRVITCADGAEAVRLYRERRTSDEPFAAVILDMTVPGGMGGKEAAQQILGIDPGAVLIISSGYSAESVFTEDNDAFFRGVVAKPYNVEKLSQELARLIKRR